MWGQCGRPATAQIVLMIWSTATPRLLRNDKNCVRGLTSVTICETCKPNVKPADFLLPEGKERIATGLARAGAAPPDFTSAKLDFEEIIGEPIDPTKLPPPGSDIIEA
jgi:hypothetical protein